MAVTANKQINRGGECRRSAPVAASTTLYEGCLQFINSSGYAVGDTGSGANLFMGITIAQVDNSAGSNGDLKSETYSSGRFLLTGSGFTQADAGKPVFATDNYTITTTASTASAVRIGTCAEYFSTTQLYVDIEPDGKFSRVLSSADQTALTDNSGGSVSDATLAVVTAPTSLTDNGGGTADGTVELMTTFTPSVAWDGAAVYPSAADATAIAAAITAIKNNIKELTTAQAANRAAIVSLTNAVAKIAELANALRSASVTQGLIKGS